MSRRIRIVNMVMAACLGILVNPAAVMAQASSSIVSIEAGAVSDQTPVRLDDGWEVAAPSQAGFDPAALRSPSWTDCVKRGTKFPPRAEGKRHPRTESLVSLPPINGRGYSLRCKHRLLAVRSKLHSYRYLVTRKLPR